MILLTCLHVGGVFPGASVDPFSDSVGHRSAPAAWGTRRCNVRSIYDDYRRLWLLVRFKMVYSVYFFYRLIHGKGTVLLNALELSSVPDPRLTWCVQYETMFCVYRCGLRNIGMKNNSLWKDFLHPDSNMLCVVAGAVLWLNKWFLKTAMFLHAPL